MDNGNKDIKNSSEATREDFTTVRRPAVREGGAKSASNPAAQINFSKPSDGRQGQKMPPVARPAPRQGTAAPGISFEQQPKDDALSTGMRMNPAARPVARPNTAGGASVQGRVNRPQQSGGPAHGAAARPSGDMTADREDVVRVYEAQSPASDKGASPAVRRAAANQAARAKQPSGGSVSQGSTRVIGRDDLERERAALANKRRREAAELEEAEEEDETPTSNAVKSIIKAVVYIVLVAVVAGILSYYIIAFGNDMYAFVKSDEQIEVEIPEYATVEEISKILGDSGIVKYPNLMVIYSKLKKIDETYKFKAGIYTVNGMMNYDELFLAFVERPSTEIVRITIPEGYTIDEMIDLFLENGIGTKEGFINVINNYEFDYDFVKALDMSQMPDRTYRLEGYLYPDTYDFYVSSKEEVVIGKMLRRFDQIFSDSFESVAAEMGYTVDQIMILASLIEKEGRYSADYETISSVFHNRLNNPKNYPKLQSDATIMYAIQVRDGERKSELTKVDLEYDTPYNSYLYDGLTPGPIANPGYEAITCALYPAKTKYYYFVSDNYGNTYYGRTLNEHNNNVAKVERINAQGE